MRAAEDWQRKAGRLAVAAGLETPPYGERIENDHPAVHQQKTLDNAFGGKGLAASLLAENGNVGIERCIGDGMGRQSDFGHGRVPLSLKGTVAKKVLDCLRKGYVSKKIPTSSVNEK